MTPAQSTPGPETPGRDRPDQRDRREQRAPRGDVGQIPAAAFGDARWSRRNGGGHAH